MPRNPIDPYTTLEVPRDADTDTIRKAYRKKAAKVHPDNPETGNVEAFNDLNFAHRLLTDGKQREVYDRLGVFEGEDRSIDEAVMLLFDLAQQCIDEAPINMVIAMRAALAQHQRDSAAIEKKIRKAMEHIEKRWRGGALVKNTLILGFEKQLSVLDGRKRAEARAKDLLEGASYSPDFDSHLIGGSSLLNSYIFGGSLFTK